jgi:hypothetical protein
LTKAKPIHKRLPNPLIREGIKDYDREGSVEKKILAVSLQGLGAKLD